MKSKDQLYDELLIFKAIEGETAAFTELMERWGPKLFYYLRRLLNQTNDVDDVMQEVWLSLFHSLPKLRDISQYRIFFFSITRSKAIDHLRKEQRRSFREVPLEKEEEHLFVENENEFSQDAEAIHHALSTLEPSVCDLLTLYYLNELSVEEIAIIVQVPKGTIKSRLHYARKILRKELSKYYE